MNISDKNIQKLNNMRDEFYKEIKDEIKDKIAEDGSIYVKLDKIEKDYTYFYKSSDYILITQKGGKIEVTDNFDEQGDLIANEHKYNLIICKTKIKKEVLADIEKYNKINDKINAL